MSRFHNTAYEHFNIRHSLVTSPSSTNRSMLYSPFFFLVSCEPRQPLHKTLKNLLPSEKPSLCSQITAEKIEMVAQKLLEKRNRTSFWK